MRQLCFFIILISSILPIDLFAQLEGANWFFGANNGLSFIDGQPEIILDSPLTTSEGCASYSTASGELLFFTNGGGRPPISGQSTGEIFDAQFNLMYDMQGSEGGGFSSQQSSIIFPLPGGDNLFYLFTMEESNFNNGGAISDQPEGRGLSYFIIDMNANNGLGAVIQADERIYVPSFENLTAVQHDNGQDYWVIVTNADNTEFVVFLVNNSGVGNPSFFDVTSIRPNSGPIIASPDRSRIHVNAVLYDFNASTGVITNPYHLTDGFMGPVGFSPNSNYLYVAVNQGFPDYIFYQFDITVADINSTAKSFANLQSTFISRFQIAPDNHIYYMREIDFGGSWLERISCANSSNPKLETIISNPTFNSVYTFPNFTDHIFRNDDVPPLPIVDLGPDINNCDGQSELLDAGNPGMTYLWSTGDTSQMISVDQSGIYTVTVSNNCCQEVVDEITVLMNPEFELLASSTEICGGELITVPIDLIGVYPMTISYLNNGMPEVANLNVLGDSLTIFVQGPTLLSFSLLSNGNCSIPLTDEFTINFVESDTIYINDFSCVTSDTGLVIDVFEIPGDCNLTQFTYTSLIPDAECIIDLEIIDLLDPSCLTNQGGILTAQLNQGAVPVILEYVQLNGPLSGTDTLFEMGQEIMLNELAAGDYEIKLEAANGATTVVTFSMLIDDSNSEIQISLPGELSVDVGDSILLIPDFIFPSNTLGHWEDSAGNILCQNCTSTYVHPFENGSYYFIVEGEACRFEHEILLKVRKNENVFFPNSFSPNGDGNNDLYQFFVANNAAQVKSFRIYDRWGQLAFSALDVPAGDSAIRWDGTFKGKKYNPGIFVYFAELVFADGTERRYKGDFLLIK